MISRRGLMAAAPLAAVSGPTMAQQPAPALRGTGDLGVIIERANGSVLIVETTGRSILKRVTGLGDLSHASISFSRDERFAYLFGRDGGLTKIDILEGRIAARIVQGGNSIGGAISDDGRLIAVSNYEPGGVKVFDAETLALVADVPAVSAAAPKSKTVGIVDVPGRAFVYTLYDAGEIWKLELPEGAEPQLTKLTGIGKLPYDANVTSDGRHYFAGLFGEDGVVHVDLWQEPLRAKRVLANYGRGQEPLPVYKMPHFEGWGATQNKLFLPAVGRDELLVIDLATLQEIGRVKTHGQPVFAVARPDGRHIWVNYAHPKNNVVEVVDSETLAVVRRLEPGPAVLHLEFTPRGHEAWVSVRDTDTVIVYNTRTFAEKARLAAQKPSGIFFTARAHVIGK
ncbi:MAG TPA: cytochrome D1 domain-containing protein [Beijerinckiaceae bacterium]|nr:cytochrome D1 domain-containing protein [Beijerinckiaceae bacterium]